MFEDALLGKHAAYKAGMHCLAVTTSTAADFQAPRAAIRDFTSLTPAHLRELFGQAGAVPTADDATTKSRNLDSVPEAAK